ncbi:methyltransferase domain-containing protein [Acetobacter cibinongensis]|uniref:methyltransferase domain-containing protein n=1 Tax=Acetobacter cibinongensis TaxID=146475 RepID=UPI000A3624C6|nr:methyltransferase domain-containing protein [Acetobacter cibinongensis]
MDAPIIFDRAAVRQHRNRAAYTQHKVAPIFEAAAHILMERLADVTRTFDTALDIGGRGFVAPRLFDRGIDVVQCESAFSLARKTHFFNIETVCADEEFLPFAPGSFDLVVANLSLHWVNDLPGTFAQIRQILKPDGLFLAALPILPTLRPLKQALEMAELALSDGLSPRVSPLPTLPSCAGLLQRAGFALPVVDAEVLPLRYTSLAGLLQDLRAAGETNALALRSHTPPPRMLFPAAGAEMRTASDGSFTMPLQMAILTAWAPDKTQPQPLQPGAFKQSLASTLTNLPDPE